MNQIAYTDASCTRVRQISASGRSLPQPYIAAIGNGAAFWNGRDFTAWLGFVPQQHSTGGKATLLGISKRSSSHPIGKNERLVAWMNQSRQLKI
jgi:transposase